MGMTAQRRAHARPRHQVARSTRIRYIAGLAAETVVLGALFVLVILAAGLSGPVPA